MKHSIQFGIVAGTLAILCRASWVCADNNGLILEAELDTTEVLERLPLVARLTIRNTGKESVDIRFLQRNAGAIKRYSALVLANGEDVYRLTFVGGPQPNMPLIGAVHPLAPGASIVVGRVISLIVRTFPALGSGEHDDWHRYKPLVPGLYTGHFEVDVAPGLRLVSNDFELTIVEAQGINRKARDEIAFRHVSFFEGREAGREEYYHRGGKTQYGVDVSGFKELQDILDNYPNSTYAEWIRFWKLYHHGPVEDALQYARDNRDFPLSDNLMLRMAEGLCNQAGKYDRATYNRVRQLVAELLRDFPDGDTRAQVLVLQKRLTKKP